MDIQSSVLNELFVLYPIIIQGWVTPVKPDGIAHGGIPKALYDDQAQGLECLIDPWAELLLQFETMAADDRVNLFVNDDPLPVTGTTVKPGEETLRQRLYVPHDKFKQGVNRLHYKVIRASGNTSEDSRDLLVLYHLRAPQILDLVIPPDVIKDGVSAARAEQGVVFGFTYNNRRDHDRIKFLLGDTEVGFDVPDGTAPITHTVCTDTFREAGDNPSAVAEFTVTDQLGNSSKSPEKQLDIHLGRVDLLVPTLDNVLDADNKEVPEGTSTFSTTLKLRGTANNGQPVEIFDGSGPSAVSKGTVSANAQTGVWEHTITVPQGARRLYAQSRYHPTPTYSNVRNLTVEALIVPTLSNVMDGANNEVEEGGLTASTTLNLSGTASKGRSVEIFDGNGSSAVSKGTVSANAQTGVWEQSITVPEGARRLYAKSLYHPTNVFSNVRTLTVVAATAPTLTSVTGFPSGIPIPSNTSTYETAVTLSGTAARGQKVEVLDGATPKGQPTADATTGVWTLLVSSLSTTSHTFKAKALYGSEAESATWTLTVAVDTWRDSITDFSGNAGNWSLGSASRTARILNGYYENYTYDASGNSGILLSQTFQFEAARTYRFTYAIANVSPQPDNLPPRISVSTSSGLAILGVFTVPRNGNYYEQTATFRVPVSSAYAIYIWNHEDRGGRGGGAGGNDFHIDYIRVQRL